MLSNQFSGLPHKRLDIGWLLLIDFFVFFCLCSFNLNAGPVRRFSQQPGCRRTLVSACIYVCQPRRSTQHFSSVRHWVETTGLLCLTEEHLLQIWREFFHDFAFQGTAEQMNTIVLCQQGTCPCMSEMTTAVLIFCPAHLYQTWLLYQNMQLLSSIVALTLSFMIYRLCLVSWRVHWVGDKGRPTVGWSHAAWVWDKKLHLNSPQSLQPAAN